ncbi:MAG: hypothetical protein PWR14_981 [Thermosediminibacterales bacterium]|nr:hypothetical protein [Thermosediminibacterales bacterium]
MPKTLSQLKTDVKALVDDIDIPDNWLLSWLNQGLSDLTPVLRIGERAVADIISNKADYALPTDFYQINHVRLLSENFPLPSLTSEDFTSKGYKIFGRTLLLQPVPRKDDTIEIWYYRVPATLASDNDVPEIPEPFQHLLVWYAGSLYEVYRRDVDIEQAVYYPRYLEGKAALNNYTLKNEGRKHISIIHRWK